MTKRRQPDKVVERAKQRRDRKEATRRGEQRRAVEANKGGFPSLFGWFTKKN